MLNLKKLNFILYAAVLLIGKTFRELSDSKKKTVVVDMNYLEDIQLLQLAQGLDGVSDNKNIIVIGEADEEIDSCLTRAGRFSHSIAVSKIS